MSNGLTLFKDWDASTNNSFNLLSFVALNSKETDIRNDIL